MLGSGKAAVLKCKIPFGPAFKQAKSETEQWVGTGLAFE